MLAGVLNFPIRRYKEGITPHIPLLADGLEYSIHLTGFSVKTAQIIDFEGEQAIKLPPEFRVSGDVLSIRKDGETIILEPIRPTDWPKGFFQEIHVDDPAFTRPPQGQMPPSPALG